MNGFDWAEAGRLSTVLVIGFVLGSALTFVGLVSWLLSPGPERGSDTVRLPHDPMKYDMRDLTPEQKAFALDDASIPRKSA